MTVLILLQLLRIQNSELYKQFVIQKLKIIKKKRSDQSSVQIKEQSSDGSSNENVGQSGDHCTLGLFHGTTEDAYEKIICNGFDRNYSGVNASWFLNSCVYKIYNPIFLSILITFKIYRKFQFNNYY